ncbi:polyphenol oxidase family protein [Thermospira aquatica]|uniref:Polyphenol oxidase family protein n=1 Tax=Thermospira aquatica TaxID=2828656 RepID=A0AAX3BC46_9SPIR|nr:polyphenol oxidase family protein [Thermospira aquatica]URA09837.1 polyphenol oxidase family protein [Thermospira aquatica]
MTNHLFTLYHHKPLMGSTLRGASQYAYHTLEKEEDYPPVTSSRNELCQRLGFPHLVTLHQTHSSIVHRVSEENLWYFLQNPLIEGDGLWTTLPDILLGVFTADCLPLFFWSEDVVGIVHAGRRGIQKEIHKVFVEEVMKAGYDISRFQFLIGPHIRQCCYQVGEDVAQEFSFTYAIQKNNGWYLDLEKKVINDLQNMGVKRGESIPICTFCSDPSLWYSYRRGDRHCRHLHFIGQKKEKKN